MTWWQRLVKPLQNNRGQFNLGSLLGPGLILGGSLAQDDPVYNTGMREQAVQSLRNFFTDPNAYSNLIGTNVTGLQGALGPLLNGPGQQFLTGLLGQNDIGGIFNQYLPLLDQSQNRILNDIQTRALAGLPASFSTAMQGSELQGIRDAAQTQLMPTQQGLIADLARESLTRQMQAATSLLGNEGNVRDLIAKMSGQGVDTGYSAALDLLKLGGPDPFAEALTKLGTILTLGGGGGAGGGLGGALGGLLGGGGQQGGGGLIGQLLGSLLGGGMMDAEPGAWGGAGINLGGLGPALQSALQGALSGQGALGPANLSSLAGLFPALASGAGGYFLGSELGGRLGMPQDSQLLGAGTGAASGAGLGFLLGGPLGAGLGALAGGLGGFFDTRSQQHEQKALFLSEDKNAQADTTYEVGNFFGPKLQALGADLNAFSQLVNQQAGLHASGADQKPFSISFQSRSGDPILTPFYHHGITITPTYQNGMISISDSSGGVDGVMGVAGVMLLDAVRSTMPSVTSLDQVPGLRQEFIDFMVANTFTASNSAYSGGALGLPELSKIADIAGLQHGGVVFPGGRAMVGERGPEFLDVTPGGRAVVTPMTGGATPFGTDGTSIGSQLRAMLQGLDGPPQARQVPQFLQSVGLPAHAYGQGGIPGTGGFPGSSAAIPGLTRHGMALPTQARASLPFSLPAGGFQGGGQVGSQLTSSFSPQGGLDQRLIPLLLQSLLRRGAYAYGPGGMR